MTGKSSSVKGNYCCRQASLHLALLSSWETCDSTSFGPIDPDGLHLVLLKARIQVLRFCAEYQYYYSASCVLVLVLSTVVKMLTNLEQLVDFF